MPVTENKLFRKVMLAVLAGILVFAIGRVTRRMNAIRESEELIDASIPENAPPSVALTTVALGSFRGLIADMLWVRSAQAKEKGNYFEMVQLASWLVKLQPRFTDATAYLAWNMAYNVSVTFDDFNDRWRWVQRGIELIRDEALAYNPGDPDLYRELGWIYQHKLGQEMDDANRYYKFQLAKQVMNVVGSWPPDWESLAAAPRDKSELYNRIGPENKSALENILVENQLNLGEAEDTFRESSSFPDELSTALTEAGLREALEIYFRRRWLEQQYKLDPALILELNREYGELDWRLPEAHAIYWATRGLQATEADTNLACERMISQALSDAFRGGRLIYLEDAETIEITPNVAIVDAVNREYVKRTEKHSDVEGMKAGYKNFLIDAVVYLYTFGETGKAGEYLGKLREKYGGPRYRLPLTKFVLRELTGDLKDATYDQGLAIVQGFLFQMYRAAIFGDIERAETFELIARTSWRRYMDSTAGREEARALPPYEQMKRNAYRRLKEHTPSALQKRLESAAPADKNDAP